MTARSEDSLRELAGRLAAVVGGDHVLVGDAARQAYTGDMSWISIAAAAAGRQLSRQDVLVRPGTPAEVAATLRVANEMRVPVTPVGGRSGVQGAANADRGGIALSLERLAAIRRIDETSMLAEVDAGVVCRTFEAALNERGLTFTHYPASTEWATIGGAFAARGSGVLSSRYGKAEDHVLSLEFVTATGDLVLTPAVPRHAAGPDVTQLLAGSEGTLGVITGATVRIRRLPAARVFSAWSFPSLAEGIEAGRQLMVTGLRPAVIRLYDEDAASHSLSRAIGTPLTSPTMVLLVEGDVPDVVAAEARAVASICAAHGGRDLGEEPARTWWDKRYVFYYPPFAPELPSIWCTIDVVADYAHIAAVYDKVTAAIRGAADPKWNLQLVTHFSHWYDWGSMIYSRFKIPAGPSDLDEAMALHDTIVGAATRAALAAGAVLNDHHGVGMRLGAYMKDQFGEPGMEVLRGLKRGLDPNGILCPGKLGL